MAALEKIRSKAVLLTVVIGVALLAFILTDFLNSGRTFFGDTNTIAKVGGTKIDAMAFQRRYEKFNSQLQASGQNAGDAAIVQNQVLNQMISEILLDEELDALDIYVTDEELTEAMIGANARPQMIQFAQQFGIESPAALHDMLFNPTKYGMSVEAVKQQQDAWIEMENEMVRNLKLEKLQYLIMGSIQANELDKKEMGEANAVTNYIQFVKKDYSTLKNEDYPVTAQDIQAAYNKDKELYKLNEEMRAAHIIAVNVVPSTTDLNTAQNNINGVYTTLVSAEGVDDVRNNSDLVINEMTVRLSDIRQNDIREFLGRASVGDVTTPKFQSNTYTLTKLIGKEMGVDSINVSMMAVQGDKNLQDSVLNMLNSGASYADIQKIPGTQGQENIWQSMIGIPDSTQAKFLNAGKNYFALNQGTDGAFFFKVNEKKAPKQLYDIAQITYTVYPSTKTINDLRDSLQAFINTNNTAELFLANAAKAGYNALPARVTAETPQINGIENSREVVKWLFEANEGSVSTIFDKQNNDKMIVAALDQIFEEGYMPVNSEEVSMTLTTQIRNEKKGDALVEQYKGKATDLAGYAQLMNTSIDSTQVTFGQLYISKIGAGESELTAAVSTAEPNTLVGPVKANNSVVVFEIVKQETSKRKPTDMETERQFASTRGNQAVMRQALNILHNATDVENLMIKFY
mgnify:FL=1